MARFDAYPRPDGAPGLLLDVQADLMSHLATRVVVPLLPVGHPDTPPPARGLNPVLEYDGERYVMMTEWLAAIPRGHLRRPVASFDARWDDLVRAIYILFTGV